MKRIIILLAALSLLSCKIKTELIDLGTTSEVFTVDGVKEDLYVKSNSWMVDNFVSSKSVIQFSDKEAGITKGKYRIHTTKKVDYKGRTSGTDFFAIITLLVKDNSTKISVSPEPFKAIKSFTRDKRNINAEIMNVKISDLIESYNQYMLNDNSNDF